MHDHIWDYNAGAFCPNGAECCGTANARCTICGTWMFDNEDDE